MYIYIHHHSNLTLSLKQKSMSFLLQNLSPPKSLSSSSFLQNPRPSLTHNSSSSSLSLLTIPTVPKLQPPPPSKQQLQPTPLPKPEFDEFYVNLGLAVRTLREDMPLIFTKDLNYTIYRDDVTFVDPLNTFTGIENYKLIFWALRFHGRILFREINLEVLRIWQPSENVILIRWNLRGLPRVPWEANGQFQGTSRYKLDRNGKIYEHKVDNLAFNFPQTLTQTTSVLDLVTASPNPMFLWAPVDDVYSNYLSSWVQFYQVVRQTLVNENQLAIHNHMVTCL